MSKPTDDKSSGSRERGKATRRLARTERLRKSGWIGSDNDNERSSAALFELDAMESRAQNGSPNSTDDPTNPRDNQFARAVRLANKHHRAGDIEKFLDHVRKTSDADKGAVVHAAAEFEHQLFEANLRIPRHLTAPPDLRTEALSEWIAVEIDRLRAEQSEMRHTQKWDQELRRAMNGSAGTRTGAINPAYMQKSKYGLDELVRRLRSVRDRITADHGTFRREDIDPRSPRYIPVKEGGLGSKQVIFMANMITGRQEDRSYDENWKIVLAFIDGPALVGPQEQSQSAATA